MLMTQYILLNASVRRKILARMSLASVEKNKRDANFVDGVMSTP